MIPRTQSTSSCKSSNQRKKVFVALGVYSRHKHTLHRDVKARNFVARCVGMLRFSAMDLDNMSSISENAKVWQETNKFRVVYFIAQVGSLSATASCQHVLYNGKISMDPSILSTPQYDMCGAMESCSSICAQANICLMFEVEGSW